MIFDCLQFCSLQNCVDSSFSGTLLLPESGLWVGVLSCGKCALDDDPTTLAPAGSILIGPGALRLIAAEDCHLVAVRIAGKTAETFLQGLQSALFADGASAPAAAGLLAQLLHCEAPAEQSALCYALLCELSAVDLARPALPSLVAAAVTSMRDHYAEMYGIEELSASLMVSKSHLVRVFKASVGITPGQYLIKVRIDAAKQLLVHREYPLEVVASLCGFSGANYLCRVFKKETGLTPAAWRRMAPAGHLNAPLPLEQEMYF